LKKHQSHSTAVSLTRTALKDFRELRKEENQLRRSDWRDNYDKERDRLNAKKEEVIDRLKDKQQSIMNYRAKQASLMSLRRSNHLAQQNQGSLKQRFADFRRTMLFASMNAQDEIK